MPWYWWQLLLYSFISISFLRNPNFLSFFQAGFLMKIALLNWFMMQRMYNASPSEEPLLYLVKDRRSVLITKLEKSPNNKWCAPYSKVTHIFFWLHEHLFTRCLFPISNLKVYLQWNGSFSTQLNMVEHSLGLKNNKTSNVWATNNPLTPSVRLAV